MIYYRFFQISFSICLFRAPEFSRFSGGIARPVRRRYGANILFLASVTKRIQIACDWLFLNRSAVELEQKCLACIILAKFAISEKITNNCKIKKNNKGQLKSISIRYKSSELAMWQIMKIRCMRNVVTVLYN